jgi:hypothetical protein
MTNPVKTVTRAMPSKNTAKLGRKSGPEDYKGLPQSGLSGVCMLDRLAVIKRAQGELREWTCQAKMRERRP